MKTAASIVAAGLVSAAAMPVLAQESPPLTRNDPTQALPPEAETSEPLESRRPDAGASDAGSATLGQFTAARFVGAKALSEERLRPAWSDMVGREVSMSDLRAISRRAEQIYAEAGYPFVAVVVQPQAVDGGVIEFTVVEGRITDLTVLGTDPIARRQAAAAFQPLLDQEPLPADDMQRSYELARTLPGLSIAGALRRGSKPGGMDLVVQTRRRSWRGYVNVNNLFSDPVGPWGALIGADFFGGSLYGDQTSVQLYSTLTDFDEQHVLRLSHSRRINAQGTTLSGSYLLAEANPAGVVAPLDLATDVEAFRAEIAHPLIMRANMTVWGAAALDWSDQETFVFSSVALTEDKTRVASIRVNGEWRGDRRTAHFGAELRKGLDIGDASQLGDPLNSRPEGDPEAVVVRVSADAEAEVAPKWRVFGRFEGQWADDPLLAPEEYSVGNLSIGRGYDPGAALGDKALGVSAELRWGPFPFANGKFRASPFVFYDGVNYWNEDTFAVQERWVDSAGLGVRFDMPGRGRLDVTWAHPLRAPLGLGEGTPDDRVLVNFTATWDDLADNLFQRARRGNGQ